MGILFFVVLLVAVLVLRAKPKVSGRSVGRGEERESYDELLRRGEWKEKRDAILERDGHRCRWCGSCEGLQVHHKYYSKWPSGEKVEPWNYPDDALITLCKDCHRRAHERKVIKVYWRKWGDNY